MRLSVLRPRYPFASALALSALWLGSGCMPGASEEGDPGEDISEREESGLLDFIGHTGYLNARDFNGDSAPDIVVVNLIGDTFAVRMNKGDGTFHDVVRYPVGIKPTFLASDDFDHNSALDAAVVNAVTNDVSILRGNGDGTFQPAVSYPISNVLSGQLAVAPFGVVTGDFNNNGNVDIATSNTVSNNVSTLLGNGDGTFQPAKTYPLLGNNSTGLAPLPLATGRFDGDGNLDLVVGGATSITMFRGHGDGSFTAVSHYHTGIVISCIELADFNKDNKVDIATTTIGGSNYSILLGKGDGTFMLKEKKSSGGIAGECFGIGDLNGDLELDLAIVNTLSSLINGNVAVLLGNGDGTFGKPVSYPVGVTPWAASVADFNGEGPMDVAVANGTNTTVSILFGNGDGTLQPQIMYHM